MSVRAAPARFTAAGSATGRAGNEGINIRGLEGNQVMILVDGVRIPNSFSFGSFATGRGDFLNVVGVKAVEVLRVQQFAVLAGLQVETRKIELSPGPGRWSEQVEM